MYIKTNKPEISILTVQYKSGQYRPGLLDSLRRYTQNYEHLEICNDRMNIGFSKANNNLLPKSSGKFIVLLNPDIRVTEGWATQLIRSAESSEAVGIVAPKMLHFDGLIDSTGHDYSKWPYTVGDRGDGEKDFGQYDSKRELISCNFGCVLIKRQVFEDIGLLDERFFLYCEDVEYCHRARRAGWHVVYCPGSIVYHQRHGSGQNKWMAESRRYWPYIIRKYYTPTVLANWYVHKVKAVIAGLKNKDLDYTSSNFRAIINGVW